MASGSFVDLNLRVGNGIRLQFSRTLVPEENPKKALLRFSKFPAVIALPPDDIET